MGVEAPARAAARTAHVPELAAATLLERAGIIRDVVAAAESRPGIGFLKRLNTRDRRLVLDVLESTPEPDRRELAWMLIARGLDTFLLDLLPRAAQRRYRAFVRMYVPELKRARDQRHFPRYVMGAVPAAIRERQAPDIIATQLTTLPCPVRGHDTIIVERSGRRAFVTGMDGWIWQLDIATGAVEQFVKPPLMPAGGVQHPTDDQRIVFCACRNSGDVYPVEEEGGIYTLDTATREIRPLLQRVPNVAAQHGVDPPGTIYHGSARVEVPIAQLDRANSRPAAYFNDLSITADGRVLYCTESTMDTSMGAESAPEAIALSPHALLWRVDLDRGTVSLAARNYVFCDGVLAEGRGESVLVTELLRYRMLRLHIEGPRAGEEEEVWRDLPGMPDGMHRDAHGRIWIALLHERTGFMNWLHRNPWIKQLLIRLPFAPAGPKQNGFLALSPDGTEPLYYCMHSGKRLQLISAVTLSGSRIFLASFDPKNHGLHWLEPNPVDSLTAGQSATLTR